MNYIIKRDGRQIAFDENKIIDAILKAFKEVDGELTDYAYVKAGNIADYIAEQADILSVEEIQDLVEIGLMSTKRKDVRKAYIKYRDERTRARGNSTDKTIEEIVSGTSEYWTNENSNKNAMVASTQRDYMAGAISEDISRRRLLPRDIIDAHDKGIIHFHDIDYFAQHIFNCCLVNLEDMLQNGTVINQTLIEKPHSFATACTIATQIIAVVASGQYGGQSVSLAHLAPFVDISRQNIQKEVLQEVGNYIQDETLINNIVEHRLSKEIERGVQIMQYQINTLNTSNGQTPFVTVYMHLNEAHNEQEKKDLALIIEEVLNQRYKGTKNEAGVWVTPAFPKLIYVLDEDNVHPDSEYYYLTELAAKCTARRLVPDYISAKVMRQLKGDVYPVMGCRSALTPDRFTDKGIGNITNAKNYKEGEHRYYGRFNQGVVTINLPYIALMSDSLDDFWSNLDEYLELCHRALRLRHERLLGTPSDISPVHWQYGRLARLEKGEPIDKLLYDGYSTISLGYAGLWETVYALIHQKMTSNAGHKLGLQVLQTLNDACTKWKSAENIDYSLYGTPLESTTYKFAKALKRDFGELPHISDKDYITNSYHVHVTEPINAFSKLAFESEFQRLSPGGAISYVEVPNLEKNLSVVLQVIEFIYDNIMYAELNTKSDYCQKCGWTGEILIKGDPGHLYWECPNCGNHDQKTMNVARRTCGYIGSNWWNQGRTEEIRDRVLHLDED